MSHVDFKKWQCRKSRQKIPFSHDEFKNVPCHYIVGPHVAVTKAHVALSNLRNGDVALSILENSHVAMLILGVNDRRSAPSKRIRRPS